MALSNVFAMVQMQNNDYQNRMSMMQCGVWGGASQLLGPSMMMCMPFGFGNMASAMMMMQMMQQNMGRQAPPCFYPPQSYQPQYPQTNPNTGLPGFPISTPQGTFSTNPGFGPRIDTIRDRGASDRYPEFGRMREFADRRGSLDGTFITPHTSLEEDQANLARLNRLTERSEEDTISRIRHASPRERELLRCEEERMQSRMRNLEREGIHVGSSDQMQMRAEYTDRLWKAGKLNDGLGRQNASTLEMLEMTNRAEANEFLKFGERPPPSMARNWTWESPFNPRRQTNDTMISHRNI